MNKAIDYYLSSLMLQPDNPFVYRFLSLVYKNQGENERSTEYMNKAIELGYKEIDRFLEE
jgi:tetratricopeptide (TPR) repeat protein